MNDAPVLTAREMGLAVCRSCHTLTDELDVPCRVCGAQINMRWPRSLEKVWAYWLAGLCLYVPGNLFPIMITQTLGSREESTIIGGVVTLIELHSYSIAAVIFIASVVVPVSKFTMIALIALSIQRRWPIESHHRHMAHTVIEYIGRWSMIDVFVVAALSALIQLGGVVTITPGAGVSFFAMSVAFTMLSAEALDPRLIWDDAAGANP